MRGRIRSSRKKKSRVRCVPCRRGKCPAGAESADDDSRHGHIASQTAVRVQNVKLLLRHIVHPSDVATEPAKTNAIKGLLVLVKPPTCCYQPGIRRVRPLYPKAQCSQSESRKEHNTVVQRDEKKTRTQCVLRSSQPITPCVLRSSQPATPWVLRSRQPGPALSLLLQKERRVRPLYCLYLH